MLLILKSIFSDKEPPSLWLFDFDPPYTLVSPFISGKLVWLQKILEVSSDTPHCSGFRGDYAMLGIYSADKISVLFMPSSFTSN